MITQNLTKIRDSKIKYGASVIGLIGVFSQILMPQPVLALFGGAESDLFPLLATEAEFADFNQMAISQDCSLMVANTPESPRVFTPVTKAKTSPVNINGQRWTIVTAYSSTVDQCDASPFITAKGTMVRDGIVATNFLPFGTKIRFPQLYPDKIFVVEDRMALRNSHKVDIWFSTREEAIQFGVKYTLIEVVQ